MSWKIRLLCTVLSAFGASILAEEPVGRRPYEMVWANRTEDTHPALLDFEDFAGWTVEGQEATGTFARSRRQQLWGKYVGELVYRGDGSGPTVTLKPPKPLAVPGPFNCVNFWVYGNNWAWMPDRTTPQVEVLVLLRGSGGQQVRLSMGRVRWKEWWVMHRRLSPGQLDLLSGGAVLEGLQVSGCRNKDDRTLYFDNLAFYQEQLPPLEFEPRPKRGLEPFPGQTSGTNTGPGRLPFPTREETILPDNLTSQFKVGLEQSDGGYELHYRGSDGHLVYRYEPSTGTLGDVTARWIGRGESFQPMADGGILFFSADESTPMPPEKRELVDCKQSGDSITSTWRCVFGKRTAEVIYALRLWRKSLVIDVRCSGGEVGEFRVGRAVGVENPRLVTLPYLTCGAQRPAVLVTGPVEKPLFVFAVLDYYRSNASSLWALNQVADDGVTYNGGSRYLPKTDGRRNDCFERLFVTVSPRFEEVLPNIPNPKSPWMHVTGDRVWQAHGASNRRNDYAFWKEVARYGMTKIVITDHETGWRDAGESFTMRTRAAPGKGGDEGQADYAGKIRGLGFRYGIYNNYTDYASVNEYWNEDYVTRLSSGEWQTGWPRCYNPKPARAVELEARLAPVIQEKFRLDTAYCDVHTAVTPWTYCDFDARVPGAGTFAATFYAYGEIMLHQKKTWNGPVYSEGNNHWYYCGLTDGNYAQDQVARLDQNPWLVDFDLRKMHPLCCNFGMGNPEMFYGRKRRLGSTLKEREASLDRFLAATLAFGHTGFFVREGGMANAVRSYFNVQQIHARYARETATDIRYADEQGNLLDSTAAVATGAYRRSQIETLYSNGLKVVVNGHPTETWKTPDAELPPNGWFAKDTQEGKLVAFSALVEGHRADYVDSPAYIYADGRGQFTRFGKAACDGQMIAHQHTDGTVEVIPVGKCSSFGVSLKGQSATATALDKQGNQIGPAEVRFSRGLVYVMPAADAFSYLLGPTAVPKLALKCDRENAIPGETLGIAGRTEHAFCVPADAEPGTRLWQQFDEAWIDFTVVPLVKAELSLDEKYRLRLTSRLPSAARAEVNLASQRGGVELVLDRTTQIDFPFKRPEKEEVRVIPLKVVAGELTYQRTWWLKAEEAIITIATWPEDFETGQCIRTDTERPLDQQSGGQVYRSERSCGDVTKKCIFMHPPYRTGSGYVYALSTSLELPEKPAASVRCEIGKADGSDPGDGILFRIAVVEEDGSETPVHQKQWIKHAWTPLEADLSRWTGKQVRIKLIADVGPVENPNGDWACWTNVRIESTESTLACALHERAVKLQREPGPFPVENLAVDDLRKAKTGTLHFQSIGFQSSGQYVSYGAVNDVPLGALPSGGGNEREGIWGNPAVTLPPEAIAKLDEWNRFTIHNPGNDYFKIGRVWIELQLADGRKCSSQLTNTIHTQPPGWQYAEGTLVPFGQDIEVKIRF